MAASPDDPFRLDLVLTRTIDVPRITVWRAWTEPHILVKWYTPAPWMTDTCEIDLRSGGLFRTVMRSPEGEAFDNDSCYIEVVEGERLVFTDALGPGYRPKGEPFMTAIITLEDAEEGVTRSTARALHKDDADRDRQRATGFFELWGTALGQLVAVGKSMEAGR